jgi:hypothetical protein
MQTIEWTKGKRTMNSPRITTNRATTLRKGTWKDTGTTRTRGPRKGKRTGRDTATDDTQTTNHGGYPFGTTTDFSDPDEWRAHMGVD